MMTQQQPSSLQDIINNRMCTGCGACAALKPAHIKMRETKDENRRPSIQTALTDQASQKLANACPAISERKTDTSTGISETWGPVLEVWEGYATDKEIRFKSSSGGAVTALSLAARKAAGFAGTLHVKASRTHPELNEARLSETRDELLEGAGSRYSPASVADRLDLVEEAKGQCVVVGKPCDIAGANMVVEYRKTIRENIGLTISIFCAGTPSHEGVNALVKHLGKPDQASLNAIRYRGNGWPGDMKAEWSDTNGEHHSASTSYADGWGNVLQKHRQWRCHTCADHTGEQADISVGDPWQNPATTSGHGTSLIIVRTERGKQLLQRAITAGYLDAEPRNPNVLFDAQPNLVATKGAIWGRRMAQKLSGRMAPPSRADSFNIWKKLTLKAQAQSILGTLKRILKKRLFRQKTTIWLNR